MHRKQGPTSFVDAEPTGADRVRSDVVAAYHDVSVRSDETRSLSPCHSTRCSSLTSMR
jgi:hypothetical protein